MNAISRWIRHFRYQLDEARNTLHYPNIMAPPLPRKYDVRGINEMNAYDSYFESLMQKRMELRKQGRLEPIRREVPLHMQKQDLADYRPESLEDRALEIFTP